MLHYEVSKLLYKSGNLPRYSHWQDIHRGLHTSNCHTFEVKFTERVSFSWLFNALSSAQVWHHQVIVCYLYFVTLC